MRVIISDDHRLFREGLELILAGVEGVEVVGAVGDGRDLIELLETVPAEVVLLDLGMAQISGFGILEWFRDQFPEVKALVLSMHDGPSYARRAIELGAVGYLLKSVGKEELVRALRLVAEGYPYIQGEIAGTLVEPIGGSPHQGTQRPTGRQLEILQLLSEGLKNKQIARQLGISETTVKSHLRVVYALLDAHGRAEAATTALRLGLVD